MSNVPAILSQWGALLKSIPGATKAITDFIGGLGSAGAAAVDIGTAKAEQVSSAIRGETDAKERLRSALVDAAIQQVAANPELGRRAIEHFVEDLVKKQENREAVIIKTIESLGEDPPSEPPSDMPDDDWLNLCASYAERASSERMRQHWAQILAGEIKKPGTFSFSALQLASQLDQKTADLIQRNCPALIFRSFIPLVGEYSRGDRYGELTQLADIGFLRFGTFNHAPVIQGAVWLTFKKKMLHLRTDRTGEVTIPGAYLTRSGAELLGIISYDDDEALIAMIGQGMKDSFGMQPTIISMSSAS